MGAPIDLTGQKFGRLTVISLAGTAKTGGREWLCICDCGTERTAPSNFLRSGHIHSCGCLREDRHRETMTIHGHNTKDYKSPEYNSWCSMIQRCCNPNNTHYHNYGGRGITVCERWRDSFVDFFSDMGTRTEGTTLDRIDNDGNYESNNCQWSDKDTQLNNRRKRSCYRLPSQISRSKGRRSESDLFG